MCEHSTSIHVHACIICLALYVLNNKIFLHENEFKHMLWLQNIRKISEEIVSKEQADIRLALVEYRDHPPQDKSFITKVHDFTPSIGHMKQWLDQCFASGGGDGPEAVADALEGVQNLSWRPNSSKICVFIADAPPHGLGMAGDGFPNGKTQQS